MKANKESDTFLLIYEEEDKMPGYNLLFNSSCLSQNCILYVFPPERLNPDSNLYKVVLSLYSKDVLSHYLSTSVSYSRLKL